MEKYDLNENTARLNRAICFAAEMHSGQMRKGTERPYILHPLEVLQILNSMGAETDLLIAGVLHDTLEDTSATLEDIIENFGPDVAALVNAHSEDKSLSWDERKSRAAEELNVADTPLKMLIMADKVSNLRSMSRDCRKAGEQLWSRFSAPKEKQFLYYERILDALEDMQNIEEAAPVYWEMTALFKDLFVSFYVNEEQHILYYVSPSSIFCFTKSRLTWEKIDLLDYTDNEAYLTDRRYAEMLEDYWYKEFEYRCIAVLAEDRNISLFSGDKRSLEIEISGQAMIFHSEDRGSSSCEFYSALSSTDSARLILFLRKDYPMDASFDDILRAEFGADNGYLQFLDCCRRCGVQPNQTVI